MSKIKKEIIDYTKLNNTVFNDNKFKVIISQNIYFEKNLKFIKLHENFNRSEILKKFCTIFNSNLTIEKSSHISI